jgi:hypothetical protein
VDAFVPWNFRFCSFSKIILPGGRQEAVRVAKPSRIPAFLHAGGTDRVDNFHSEMEQLKRVRGIGMPAEVFATVRSSSRVSFRSEMSTDSFIDIPPQIFGFKGRSALYGMNCWHEVYSRK